MRPSFCILVSSACLATTLLAATPAPPASAPSTSPPSAEAAFERTRAELRQNARDLVAAYRERAFDAMPHYASGSYDERVTKAMPRTPFTGPDSLYGTIFGRELGKEKSYVLNAILAARDHPTPEMQRRTDYRQYCDRAISVWSELVLDRPAPYIDKATGKEIFPPAWPAPNTLFLKPCLDAAFHQEFLASRLTTPDYADEQLAHLQHAVAYYRQALKILEFQPTIKNAITKFADLSDYDRGSFNLPEGLDHVREFVPGVFLVMQPHNMAGHSVRLFVTADGAATKVAPDNALQTVLAQFDTTKYNVSFGQRGLEAVIDRALEANYDAAWRVETPDDIPTRITRKTIPPDVAKQITPLYLDSTGVHCFVYVPLQGVLSEWSFKYTPNLANNRPKVHHPEATNVTVKEIARELGDAIIPMD